jgi:LysR family transcriptional regulator, regulator for genes of the gallate degradation pathway
MHRPTRQARVDRPSETAELHLSFRLIRTLLGVAEYRNITRAAKELNHSQASITKQIQLLEQKLGAPLFDRTTKGMTLTAYGEALLPRASASAAAFRQVRSLAPKQSGQPSSGACHFYNMDVSDRWLAALLAVTEHQNVTEAAHRMDISTAAVLSSLKKLERSFGLQLFAREANRLIPTPFAAALAQCVRIAANELALARHELASLSGGQRGRVTVGALPYARTMIVPRAITRLLERHEHIEVTTFEDN